MKRKYRKPEWELVELSLTDIYTTTSGKQTPKMKSLTGANILGTATEDLVQKAAQNAGDGLD